MSQTAFRRMTPDEFLQWDLDQPDARHELIDGVPVAMTGAQRRHDRVVMNGIRELSSRLRRGPCLPFTADVAVRISNGNVRRPDIGVDCGPVDDTATYAATPRLLVEVLSPSTRPLDQARKLEEYKSIGSVEHILLVEQSAPEVILWSRDVSRSWSYEIPEGLDAIVDLPALGIALQLADLYEGIAFSPPRHGDA